MKRVNFQDGTKTQEAKVTIDGTDYEVTPAEWSGTTPLSAFNLNRMQDNIEEEVNIVQETEEAEEVEITNVAPVNGKIDVSGNSTQRLLPEEYQEVEYIGVTGTQYIDTGFKATNNTKISIDATVSNLDASGRFLFGARNAERTDTFTGLIWTDNKVSGGYGSGSIWQSNVVQPINEKFNLTLDKNLLYHNNTLLKTFNTQTFTATNNIWIGALNNNGSISQAHHGNIYFCKIWDNETPVREYIPCYRKSDNVIGMYDLVSKTFFTNAGTGTFTKGNDVAGNYLVSPTYPIEIRNCGDNVNLFNPETKVNNRGLTWTNGSLSLATGWVTTDYIDISNIDWISSNYYFAPFLYDENKTYIVNNNHRNYYKQFQIPKSGTQAKYIRVHFKASQDTNPSDMTTVTDIKIQEGDTSNVIYSPYNCGNANIEVSNKNKFKNDFVTLAYNSVVVGQTTTLVSGANYRGAYAKVEEGQIYSISKKVSPRFIVGFTKVVPASGVEVLVYATNNNATKIENITIPSGYKYIFICLSTTAVDSSTLEIMIEKNPTATSYVPHQEQLITFPFTEGQRLYKGDYLASDGMHHTRKQIILNNTMDIGTDTSTENYVRFYFRNVVNDYNSYPECLSNVALAKPSSQSAGDYLYFFMTKSTNSYIYFNIPKTIATTVDGFKTWLSTNPITVEYELATEEIESYTPEQAEVYWQLQHTLMYEGLTYVECIDETKAKFVVTYSYNNDINVTYGKRIDDLEYKIHQLENIVNNLSQ